MQHKQRGLVAPPWAAWCSVRASWGKLLVFLMPLTAASERCILPFKKPCADSTLALPDSRCARLRSMPTSAASLHASSRTQAPPFHSPPTSRSGPMCKPSKRSPMCVRSANNCQHLDANASRPAPLLSPFQHRHNLRKAR